MDEAKKKRAIALEEKKKRIEEMRRQRAERESKLGASIESATPSVTSAQTGGEDFNDYINSLLSTPAPVVGKDKELEDSASGDLGSSSTSAAKVGDNPATSGGAAVHSSKSVIMKGLGKVTILPTSTEVYHKWSQTDELPDFSFPEKESPCEGPLHSPHFSGPSKRRHSSVHSIFPPKSSPLLDDEDVPLGGDDMDSVSPRPAQLSEKEKEEILELPEFQEFFSKSSLLVERLLGKEAHYDAFVDYSGHDRSERKGKDVESVSKLFQFYEERWCQDRAIMDIQWSPHYAELLLAAYNTRSPDGQTASTWTASTGASDPDGLVLVWSLAMQQRPEYQFICQSPVLTARFHDFNSHTIIGGTYSGQIVLWDTRAKQLPVQRTPLSTSGHTHPVYCMAMVGLANNHSLVTASSDGKICFWNLSQLSEPVDVIDIQVMPQEDQGGGDWGSMLNQGGGKAVAISAFSFDNEKGANELLLGSESGNVYVAPLHKRPAVNVTQHDAHFGMITAMHRNPSHSKALSNLLLTSSVDWSMRLWNLKKSTDPIAILNHGTYDYVSDVRWCPTNPAVFSSVTSGGELFLWNLNQSLEEPVIHPVVVAPERRCALNKLSWSSEGRKIAAADAKGYVHVMNVAEELIKPRIDEELRLETTLENYGSHVAKAKMGQDKDIISSP